ncbi:hypothetical protein [Methylobacterium sp. SD21]|uniref:hypothetical protein n=1 Tax=Methylobacterium litchii TaxID=3138810 RepID=UPI00313B6B1A
MEQTDKVAGALIKASRTFDTVAGMADVAVALRAVAHELGTHQHEMQSALATLHASLDRDRNAASLQH